MAVLRPFSLALRCEGVVRRPLPVIACLLGTLSLAACGGGGASAAAGGLDGPDVEVRPELTEIYRVGSMDGEDWETFSRVPNTAFDAAGNLYVFDPENHRVVVLDREGTFLRQIGSAGEGPGELRQPMSMAVRDDGTVVILDLGHQSWVIYAPNAEPQMVRANLSDGVPTEGLLPHPDGGLVSAGVGIRVRTNQNGPPRDGLAGLVEEPPFVPIRRFTLDGESPVVVYEAWRPPEAGGPDAETTMEEGEGRTMAFRMSPLVGFDPETLLAVLADGRLAVVDSTTYKVTLVGSDGTPAGALTRAISPRPVGSAEREAERRRQLDALEGQGGGRLMVVGGGGGRQINADAVQNMMRGRVESMLFREEIPVVTSLAADRNGRLWIGRAGSAVGESGPTDIVTADGDYLGSIPEDHMTTPDAFGPDGLVAYIEMDEFDVPTVVVKRLSVDW